MSIKDIKDSTSKFTNSFKVKLPAARKALDQTIKNVGDLSDSLITDTKELVDTITEHESSKKIIDKSVSLTRSVSTEVMNKSNDLFESMSQKKTDVVHVYQDNDQVKAIHQAIDKLSGRDIVGKIGESLSSVVGGLAGLGLSGTIASYFGATTILGSSTLGGMLGGIFVTATPVGWVIGTSALLAISGYGISKMVHSGGKQDQFRSSLIADLKKKLSMIEVENKDKQNELNMLVELVVNNDLIKKEAAIKMVDLVSLGKMKIDIAINRLTKIAVTNGIQIQAEEQNYNIEKIHKKLSELETTDNKDIIVELNQIITILIMAEFICIGDAEKIINLLKENKINPTDELQRIKEIAIDKGLIQLTPALKLPN